MDFRGDEPPQDEVAAGGRWILPYVGSLFAFFRNFFDFLGILSYLVFSQRFFLILDRFFEVLGGVWEGFWEEFSVIFCDFFEKRETVWRATKHCVGA